MPLCKYGCGEEVQLRQEENGKWNPYSMQLHFRSPVHIAHVRGPKKPKRPKAPVLEGDRLAVAQMLQADGYTQREAWDAALRAKGDDLRSIYASATGPRAKELTS